MAQLSPNPQQSLGSRLALIAPFFIGYGLLDAWTQAVYSASFFATPNHLDQILEYAPAILPGLVLLPFATRLSPLVRRRHREAIYLIATLATAATVTLLFVERGLIDYQWAYASEILVGILRGLLIICWFEKLSMYGISNVWFSLGLAVLVGAIVNVSISLLPVTPAYVIFATLPLFSAFFLQTRRGEHRPGEVPGDNLADRGDSNRQGEQHRATSLSSLFKLMPWALVVVFALATIPSEGLVLIESEGTDSAGTILDVLFNGGLHMCVNLAAVVLAALAARANIKIALYVGIPAILIATLVLALGPGSNIVVLHTISRIGSETIHVVVIYLLVRAAFALSVPPAFSFSAMTALHALGAFLGLISAWIFTDNSMALAFTFAVILIIAMLFAFAAQSDLAPAKTTGDERDETEMQVRFVERYGLTPRESEVLDLWVKGHDTAFIEEQLCVSKYTVKTHVEHIYEKTGTNSKETLIQRYEEFSSED